MHLELFYTWGFLVHINRLDSAYSSFPLKILDGRYTGLCPGNALIGLFNPISSTGPARSGFLGVGFGATPPGAPKARHGQLSFVKQFAKLC